MANFLLNINRKELNYFHEMASNNFIEPYLNIPPINNRILGCINSNDKCPPLKYNLDNTQTKFALCDASTKTNVLFPIGYGMDVINVRHLITDVSSPYVQYKRMHIMPPYFTQPIDGLNNQNGIYFGKCQNYIH